MTTANVPGFVQVKDFNKSDLSRDLSKKQTSDEVGLQSDPFQTQISNL